MRKGDSGEARGGVDNVLIRGGKGVEEFIISGFAYLPGFFMQHAGEVSK